jgi:glycine cleavage system H protein
MVGPWLFPADRLYTDGHLWVQTIREGRIRAGLDAYASRILHPIRQLRCACTGDRLGRGDRWCTLVVEAGELPLGVPVAGRVCRWNADLDETPGLMTVEPYGRGWLAEIDVARSETLEELRRADEARERASHDARQFRRNVAFHLLSGEGAGGPELDDTFVETALRLVGPGAFVSLARQFLH